METTSDFIGALHFSQQGPFQWAASSIAALSAPASSVSVAVEESSSSGMIGVFMFRPEARWNGSAKGVYQG
jgi:hypothetical protein